MDIELHNLSNLASEQQIPCHEQHLCQFHIITDEGMKYVHTGNSINSHCHRFNWAVLDWIKATLWATTLK